MSNILIFKPRPFIPAFSLPARPEDIAELLRLEQSITQTNRRLDRLCGERGSRVVDLEAIKADLK